MVRTRLAIATAMLVATTGLAAAQSPSYESRGYGGPLYVGPNFKSGGQSSPPVYSPNSTSKKRYTKTRQREEPAVKKTDTAESSEKKSDTNEENSSISRAEANSSPAKIETAKVVESENSTISRANADTDKDGAKTTQNLGCKKYFPTAAMTLSVPCE